MTALLLIAGGIILLVILALIYRIFTLVSIAKGTTGKKAGMSNRVNAILFPITLVVGFGAIFWYSGVAKDYFLPEAASVHGKEIDFMFWTSMAIIFVAFLVTHILLFVFPYKYQYKENTKGFFYPHNDRLEVVWTVVPAIVMTFLVIYGYVVWRDVTAPAPDDSLEVEIVGKQFNWIVRYAGPDGELGRYDYKKIDATNTLGIDFRDPKSIDDFVPREIHLPKGKNVLLRIRARDVLHSVFMPHFRVKMDAVPGMPTKFWFTPTLTTEEMRQKLSEEPAWQEIDPKTGEPRFKNFNYELACTEICGGGHFAMRMVIVVSEPDEFEAWYNSQESWASKNLDYLSTLEIPGLDVANIK
jgi:cytochrome c oxidase subunit 2